MAVNIHGSLTWAHRASSGLADDPQSSAMTHRSPARSLLRDSIWWDIQGCHQQLLFPRNLTSREWKRCAVLVNRVALYMIYRVANHGVAFANMLPVLPSDIVLTGHPSHESLRVKGNYGNDPSCGYSNIGSFVTRELVYCSSGSTFTG